MTQTSRIILYRWIAVAFIAIAASTAWLPAQAQRFHVRSPPAYHGRWHRRPIYHGRWHGRPIYHRRWYGRPIYHGGNNGLIVGALMGSVVGAVAAGALQPPPPPPPGVGYYYPGN